MLRTKAGAERFVVRRQRRFQAATRQQPRLLPSQPASSVAFMGTHAESQRGRPVIVGVSAGQSPRIVIEAARFAQRFDAELVCAHVNPASFATSETGDGAMLSAPIDPDFADDMQAALNERLSLDLSSTLQGINVRWRLVPLAGDVATALSHLADTLDASMVVVGAREHSIGGALQEFFNRSVAVNLVRQQQRPVVVIPRTATRPSTSELGKA